MSTDLRQQWYIAFLAVAVYVAATLAIFWSTAESIVAIWIRSETFAHGFVIVPISLWLIWQKRIELTSAVPKPWFPLLVVVAAAAAIWTAAALVDVLVIQQIGLVTLLVSGVALIIGKSATRSILFPLLFLYFAVPIGEGLVPYMMDYTANVTVKLVSLSGVPVYQEGLYFYLPTGSWSVVAACSGVRYLIASVCLGALFSYLNYSSYKKRAIFILISAIAPIIANALRAYLVVMLGHLSNMTLAVGTDHLVYGWILFGLVIFAMFGIGIRWRDEMPQPTKSFALSPTDVRPKQQFVALLVAISVPLLFFSYLKLVDTSLAKVAHASSIEVSTPIEGFNERESDWGWQPIRSDATHNFSSSYFDGGKAYLLAAHLYIKQEQGAELVNSSNVIISEKRGNQWRVTERSIGRLNYNGSVFDVQQLVVQGRDNHLLVWSWYRVGDDYTGSNYRAKFYEFMNKVTFGRTDGSQIIAATDFGYGGTDLEDAKQRLQKFVVAALPPLETGLDRVVGVNLMEARQK